MTVDELKFKWGNLRQQVDHVFTWTEDYALCYLAERAHTASIIVESGTYMGASALMMLMASHDTTHLWCVDPFMVPGTYKCTAHILRDYINNGQCELIAKRSPQAAIQLEHMRGKIDLVFVDDGHAYQDVVDDIKAWLPLLRSGGIICGHDYEHPDNDVTRAVRDLLPGHTEPVPRVWEYVKP